MLIEGKRPRELHWYHAAPMLFGDWGTSRLYVLGLAFYYTRHASLWFMLAMSLLLIGVGWAYNIICRIYPDGGGVYSSARHRSPTLAVIGGLLLCADYLVTAAISALDAFHYLNVQRPELFALASLIAIGCVNYFGPRKSGTIALVIAILTIVLTLILGLFALPSLDHAHIERPTGNPLGWWAQFTSLILAISGVEAIANMTGLMVLPVKKTAAWSIWPVLTEIVILNLVLTVAMLAMPLDVLGGGNPEHAYTLHRDDMLRAIAAYYVGPAFAAGSAIVFALLLLSAANTAITDLVSIQFMMSRDRELPAPMGLLNAWGMPLVPLALATAVPVILLIAVSDVEKLADLYAIGVVGAVAINLGTCSTNSKVELSRFQRFGMGGLATLMIAIWITVAYEKPHALVFALSIMGTGLTVRYVVRNRVQVREWMLTEFAFQKKALEEARVGKVEWTPAAPPKHIVVATPGRSSAFRFALSEAKSRNAQLHVLFVRHLAIPVLGTPKTPDVDVDPEARRFFDLVVKEAEAAGVMVHCSYVVAPNIARAVVDFAVACVADVLILPAPLRGRVWRAMKGNVIRNVARRLPKHIRLLVQS
jgi:amino acid transporter/nucleotide-binding universal stress UspA family protein